MAAAIHSGQLAGLVAPDAAGALLPEPSFDEDGDADFDGDGESDFDGESDVDDESFEPALARLSVR
jgi:hypothetical protein